jgi:hypothetical protein
MSWFRPLWRAIAVVCAIIAPVYASAGEYGSSFIFAACGLVFLVLHHHSTESV